MLAADRIVGNIEPHPMKTKGEIEAAISDAMVRFEIEYMGRGPKEARSHIIDDLIVVRLKGVLTPAEQQLAKCADGVELIKKMRSTLIDSARGTLSAVISDASGAKVLDILTDINTASGERVFIFVLEANLGRDLPRKITA
jgi:uncharacterized protein YbcI